MGRGANYKVGMEKWDSARSYIAKGGLASWPRDMFESYLCRIDELEKALREAMGWNWLDEICPPPLDVVEQCESALRSNENKKPNLKAPAKGILAFLNKKTSHNYRAVDANLNPIIARLKSGVTPGQVKQVIAMKVREWGTDERMGAYLRPKTLFARSNFENYLGCLKEQEV